MFHFFIFMKFAKEGGPPLPPLRSTSTDFNTHHRVTEREGKRGRSRRITTRVEKERNLW
jgi:hypothetical protein